MITDNHCDREVPLPGTKINCDENDEENFHFLSIDDLLRLDDEEPKWKKIRKWLMFGFLFAWIILLIIAVVSVLLADKCHRPPNLPFWQKGVGYWVNPLSFKDSNGDGIGDLNGLKESLSYIKHTLGLDYIVITSILLGEYTNNKSQLGLINDYEKIDPVLGDFTALEHLIDDCHKNGIMVVVTLDFNAISTEHGWITETDKLQTTTKDINLPSRFTNTSVVTIKGKEYYSVENFNKVDLNLLAPSIKKETKNIIKFWLEKGIDGILFDNVGFLTENFEKTSDAAAWFSKFPEKQLYSKQNVEVLKSFTEAVVQFPNGDQKLIILDVGNTGYAFESKDKSLEYIKSGAKLVISRLFVTNSGSKNGQKIAPSLKLYNEIDKMHRESLSLVAASPSDIPSTDYTLTAYTLLLPGSTIVYFGSELFNEMENSPPLPEKIFPMGKTYYTGSDVNENIVSSSLPMPWDSTGHGFTNSNASELLKEYVELFREKETVMHVTAEGREFTPFHLVKKLIFLRSHKESLQYGELKLLNNTEHEEHADLFVRQAEGFPAFIACIIRTLQYRLVANFSLICPKVKLQVMYPEIPNFSYNTTYNSDAIYLKTDDLKAVFLFECA